MYQGAIANQSTEEIETIRKGKTIFKIIMVNIICMMIFDSVFSALSPYLWLGDVFVKNDTFVQVYMFSTSMFYIANTFFACLLIYVMHHFGHHVEVLTSSKKLADTNQQETMNGEKTRPNSYLDLHDESQDNMQETGLDTTTGDPGDNARIAAQLADQLPTTRNASANNITTDGVSRTPSAAPQPLLETGLAQVVPMDAE